MKLDTKSLRNIAGISVGELHARLLQACDELDAREAIVPLELRKQMRAHNRELAAGWETRAQLAGALRGMLAHHGWLCAVCRAPATWELDVPADAIPTPYCDEHKASCNLEGSWLPYVQPSPDARTIEVLHACEGDPPPPADDELTAMTRSRDQWYGEALKLAKGYGDAMARMAQLWTTMQGLRGDLHMAQRQTHAAEVERDALKARVDAPIDGDDVTLEFLREVVRSAADHRLTSLTYPEWLQHVVATACDAARHHGSTEVLTPLLGAMALLWYRDVRAEQSALVAA